MRKVLHILGQLADADVEWLIANGVRQRLAPGTVLIQEDQPLDMLYLLLDGTLRVSFPGRGGQRSLRLGCGEVLGEVSFIDSRPSSATVTVAEPSPATVLAIPMEKLTAWLESDLAFTARFYRAIALLLANRLRCAASRLEYLPNERVDEEERLATTLDPDALDRIHKGGARFDRILQRFLAD